VAYTQYSPSWLINGPTAPRPRLLIQFGSVRTPPQVAASIATMETTLFDGIVLRIQYTDPTLGFTNLDQQVSRSYAVPYSLLAPSLAIIQGTAFDRFEHNFLRLDIARPGESDFSLTSDRDAFVNNVGVAARAALASGHCRGLLLDMEAYDSSPLWDYNALGSGLSFSSLQAHYYTAGYQMQRRIELEYQSCIVVIAVSYEQLKDVTTTSALQADRYGLLPKFLDGMHDAAYTSKLVCMNEESYANSTPADQDYDISLQTPPNVPWMNSENYLNVHEHGLSTWIDNPGSGFSLTTPTTNTFTPAKFRANLQQMGLRVGRYSFVYSQAVRWPGWGDTPGVDTVPADYIRALNTLQDTRLGLYA